DHPAGRRFSHKAHLRGGDLSVRGYARSGFGSGARGSIREGRRGERHATVPPRRRARPGLLAPRKRLVSGLSLMPVVSLATDNTHGRGPSLSSWLTRCGGASPFATRHRSIPVSTIERTRLAFTLASFFG